MHERSCRYETDRLRPRLALSRETTNDAVAVTFARKRLALPVVQGWRAAGNPRDSLRQRDPDAEIAAREFDQVAVAG